MVNAGLLIREGIHQVVEAIKLRDHGYRSFVVALN
jgi:hypothetical protein